MLLTGFKGKVWESISTMRALATAEATKLVGRDPKIWEGLYQFIMMSQ